MEPELEPQPVPKPSTSFPTRESSANIGTVYERSVCPLDPSHVHQRGRNSVDHLFQCLKEHPELAHLIRRCPFNASHWIRVDTSTMEAHLETCTEFKQWIFTQTANGAPLSLDPRDLINTGPGTSTKQDQQEPEDKKKDLDLKNAPAGIPAFLQDFMDKSRICKPAGVAPGHPQVTHH